MDGSGEGSRVIVFRPGALGDTLVTVPALRALRRGYPGSTVELVGNAAAGRVLVERGLIDRVTSFDAQEVMSLFDGEPQVAERWKDAALVVLWMNDTQLRGDAFLRAGARQVVGASPNDAPAGEHVGDYLTATLAKTRAAPAQDDCVRPLRVMVDGERSAEILIHPGSGSARKNWSAVEFAALIRDLRVGGHPTTLVRGPADEEAVGAVQAELGADQGLVLIEDDVARLADRLAQGRLYLGNDSGVSHLAGWMGTPTVAIFGNTDPHEWAPRGPSVRIVGKRNRWPPVEEVRRTATTPPATALAYQGVRGSRAAR